MALVKNLRDNHAHSVVHSVWYVENLQGYRYQVEVDGEPYGVIIHEMNHSQRPCYHRVLLRAGWPKIAVDAFKKDYRKICADVTQKLHREA